MQGYHDRRPQFAFSFHGELSHDSINLVGVADDDLKEWLGSLKTSGLLNRTILILMADHGNRWVSKVFLPNLKSQFENSIWKIDILSQFFFAWVKFFAWLKCLNFFFTFSVYSFAEVRNSLQGKLEERLPFFSFIFPEAFKKRYSKEYAQFKENTNRLVTPFDVHETFLDILRKFFFRHFSSKHLTQKSKLY